MELIPMPETMMPEQVRSTLVIRPSCFAMYACMYVCTHIHTHTHTHKQHCTWRHRMVRRLRWTTCYATCRWISTSILLTVWAVSLLSFLRPLLSSFAAVSYNCDVCMCIATTPSNRPRGSSPSIDPSNPSIPPVQSHNGSPVRR